MNAPLRSHPLPAPIARRLAAPIAACAVLAVLVGCSAGASGPSGGVDAVDAGPAPYSAEVDQGAVDGAAPEQADGSGAVDADRVVVVNSTVGMRSPDVEAAVADVEAAALGAQGYVEARDIRTGATRPTANVTMRVPAERHDAMIDELREIGDVTTVTTSAQDVTLATIDIAARIESLESSISSLRGMLERATEVEDMLRVEQELSTREGEMLSLQQQLDWLEDQAAMSTITVSITATSDTVVDPDDDLPGFGTGLATGWNDLVRFFTGAVAVLGYMIPGIGVALLLAAIVWFAVVVPVRRRQRRAEAQAQAQPHPEDRPEDRPEVRPEVRPEPQPEPQPEAQPDGRPAGMPPLPGTSDD